MKKIPTVFRRDPDNMRRLLTEVHPDCQWVLDGEGVATRKIDGTCVMFDGEHWWSRREVKPGKEAPANFRQEDFDPVTGKTTGWMLMEPQGSKHPFLLALRWAEEHDGLDRTEAHFEPGTYELIGPKVNGNPESIDHHRLVRHDSTTRLDPDGVPRDFESIKALVLGLAEDHGWEGIVYHHPDGRMAKIKARDFQ